MHPPGSAASSSADSDPPTETLRANDPHDVSPSQARSTPLTGPEMLSEKHIMTLAVDWDGPDDPRNPQNWSFKKKWAVTAIVSGYMFISSVSSSMIAPAADQVALEFGVHNNLLVAFTTSIFVLAYAIGPLFLAPLSEIYGRPRVLQLANLWFLAWNVGCGLAQNESQLLTFRFLAGIGGSAPFVIGNGVLADCWCTEERGKAVAIYSLIPLLAPAIGPIAGSWIAAYSTWKWVFWSTSIADAVVQLLGFFYLRETYAPVLLERKAAKIRLSMDVEKSPCREIRTIFDEGNRSWRTAMGKSLVRPFTLFAGEPILQLFGLYMAYLYGVSYLFVTTIPTIFKGIYRQSLGISGLHYIPLGMGYCGASQLNARVMDKLYLHLTIKNGSVGRPEFRLPVMLFGTALLPIGLLITGWSVELQTHWIFPDIGILLVGASVSFNFQCSRAYLVDAFTLYAASTMAAVYCLRSFAGCGFPLFAPAMYAALGFGKGNTVLAVVAIVIGCPTPWIFWHFGERIRNASQHAR